MRLAVDLYGVRVGTVVGDARAFDFSPTAEAMDQFGANSLILSVIMPLTPVQRRDHSSRRRTWFAELLPEGDQYAYMLAQGGIRRGDTPAFLARYGRDVAGALQVWDLEDPTEPKTPSLRALTPADVRALLTDPLGAPLANDARAGKSSLGGVQPKVVLVRDEHGWSQALGGYPSTHILKPQLSGQAASVIYDEEYGSRLARGLRLAAFATTIEHFDGTDALVIERFDRDGGERIHQEDFNQALGASGNQKYQIMGGVVSLRRVAAMLARTTTGADLERLARMVVFAVAIGNLDMHTKNLALIHTRDGDVTLAPAYDVVPQVHGANDGELALAINGKYRHGDITREDVVAELASWGIRRPEKVLDPLLEELGALVSREEPLAGAHPTLPHDIAGFIAHLQQGGTTGGAPQ